jgi:hypothetical protein
MKSFAIGTLWFSSLVLPSQATADTVRGVQRELTESEVNLGSAEDYRILTKTGISTTGTTEITGAIAVSPITSTAITGFSLIADAGGLYSKSSLVVTDAGTLEDHIFAASYGGATATALTAAVSDMEIAYTDAAGRTNTDASRINLGDGDLGGAYGGASSALTPGIYTFTTAVTIPASIHLSGDENAIYIFQIAGALSLASGVEVIFDGGVVPSNVFWQVAEGVTVGTTAAMQGIILSKTAVVFQNQATLEGRIYAQTAATLDANTVG